MIRPDTPVDQHTWTYLIHQVLREERRSKHLGTQWKRQSGPDITHTHTHMKINLIHLETPGKRLKTLRYTPLQRQELQSDTLMHPDIFRHPQEETEPDILIHPSSQGKIYKGWIHLDTHNRYHSALN